MEKLEVLCTSMSDLHSALTLAKKVHQKYHELNEIVFVP